MCSIITISLERIHVENYKESEILLYLQESKLSYHSFVDAGRRHKTPGSELKDSLLLPALAVARVLAFICASSLGLNSQFLGHVERGY